MNDNNDNISASNSWLQIVFEKHKHTEIKGNAQLYHSPFDI